MSVTFRSNLSSLMAQNELSKHTSELGRVFERLSSGLRINSPSDDAAGVAISASLSSDAKVYGQGVRNINDGISLLNIADAAVGELTNIVTRLQELANQSASGAYSDDQREALNSEAQALADEYNRIARSTKFNGQMLFDGDLESLSVQMGYGDAGSITDGLGGAIFGDGFTTSDTSVYAISGNQVAMDLGDINGDGHLDLVSGGQSASVYIQLGDGQGGFGPIASSAFQVAGMYELQLVDLNSDGNLDIVGVGGDGASGGFSVSLGNGDGTFGATTFTATDVTYSLGMVIEDFDGDGNLDVVTSGYNGGNGSSHIALGNGDGTFGAATNIDNTLNVEDYSVASGDINNDGNLDFVVNGHDGSQGWAFLYEGDGAGGFVLAGGFQTSTLAGLDADLVDLDGDGNLDLVTTGQDSGNVGVFSVHMGNGDSTFDARTDYTTSNPGVSYDTELVDLNSDGHLDVVVAGADGGGGHFAYAFGNGDGTFGTIDTYSTDEALWTTSVELGDLNEDGVLDVVTGGNSGNGESSVHLSNTVSGIASLADFDISTQAGALQAASVFDFTLDNLNIQQGEIGAFKSRLGSALTTTRASVENYLAANSRIVDADIASEVANMTSLQIRQQAATAVLAQANQQPSMANRLLSLSLA